MDTTHEHMDIKMDTWTGTLMHGHGHGHKDLYMDMDTWKWEWAHGNGYGLGYIDMNMDTWTWTSEHGRMGRTHGNGPMDMDPWTCIYKTWPWT